MEDGAWTGRAARRARHPSAHGPRSILLLVIALLALLPGALHAASRYDPAFRFRVLSTPHFFIYFHQGESARAARVAVVAEDVHRDLTARLLYAPSGRTHVVLVDQNDVANGWATPLPYNSIEITVGPPPARDFIGNNDDWLRLALIHEYTHVLQLDRSRGFAAIVHGVFGRMPLAFPNLFLPGWQTEGLAVYEESAMTGRGRLHGGDFRTIVGTAARAGRAWWLDRATSDFDTWPAGQGVYAYGAFFHEYLAQRFGDAKLAELQQRTAGRLYFFQSRAYRRVFGKTLGELWEEFEQAHVEAPVAGSADRGQRLTNEGYEVTGPQFVAEGDGRVEIVYSSRTTNDFPSLNAVDLSGRARRLTSRYYGDEAGVAGTRVIFDQQEVSRNVALRSDLYLLDVPSRQVSRLTRNMRLLEPSIDRSGRQLAAIAIRDGVRQLWAWSPRGAGVELPLAAYVEQMSAALATRPQLIVTSPEAGYESPRWSPDGRWLAVARVLRGGPSQIVLVDPGNGNVTVVVSSTPARNVTPAWTPDGRALLFSSDRGGGPFNVFAVDVETGTDGRPQAGRIRQITSLGTGATYPAVSPDGTKLAYVGYTADGYDLFVLPLASGNRVGRISDELTSKGTKTAIIGGDKAVDYGSVAAARVQPQDPPDPVSPLDAAPYRPFRTLLPRYWTPAVESTDEQVKVGAATSAIDILGRHSYTAEVLYRVAGKEGPAGSPRLDWDLAYAYDRWVPTFFVEASDHTDFLADVLVSPGATVPADIRTRALDLGVSLPWIRTRYQQAWTATLNVRRETRTVGPSSDSRDRNAVRLSWWFNSAKIYARSISPEQGMTAGVGAEMIRPALGADGTADDVTADARAYLRLGRQHAVVAARGGIGWSRGNEGDQRVFYLGGPGPNVSPVNFGTDALNLLRGYDLNTFFGTRLVVGNLEYRAPIVRVERGPGTFPLFVRAVHAAAFVDAGKAWSSSFSARPFQYSAGVEVSVDLRIGYVLPVTIASGMAWPHDGHDRPVSRPVTYVRIGRSF